MVTNSLAQPYPRSGWGQDEDRLSALSDDILLRIVGGLGLRAVVRASVLSRRWRNIPRLLSDLTIDVVDFVPRDYGVREGSSGDNREQLRLMMQAYADAAMWLLAPRSDDRALKSVRLRFLLSEPYLLHTIGRAIEGMVEEGNMMGIESMELDMCMWTTAVPAEPVGCGGAATTTTNNISIIIQQQQHKATSRRYLVSFLDAYPVAFGWLTSLTLQNLCFVGCSDFPRLLSSCTRMKLLSLSHCDFGGTASDGGGSGSSIMEIGAPHAQAQQLVALEIRFCCFLRVELIQAPKLRRFRCDTWYADDTPVRFGHVPLLRSVTLACDGHPSHLPFALSKCISSSGVAKLSTLYLDFRDGKIWIQPEHRLSFINLRDVYLRNIFELCDLDWTLFILESAPSLKNLYITLSRHVCKRNKFVANVLVDNVKWETSDFEHHNLQLLEIVGYATEFMLDEYIRIVMEHAVCLKRIHLLEQDFCSKCGYEPGGRPRRRSLHEYPSTEREKNDTRSRLTEELPSPVKIIIR